MSTIEPDDGFVSEEELKALLEKWQSPKPSAALDDRITSSYLKEISQASVLSDPIRLPKTNNEVVKMKFCSLCQEEFADKFSFCPVDATPLTSVARVEEPSVTAVPSNGDGVLLKSEPEPSVTATPGAAVAAGTAVAVGAAVAAGASGSQALSQRGEYHLTIMNDTGLASRLGGEIKDVGHEYELTWPEFKRDPIGFVKRSAIGYGQVLKRFLGNRNVVVAMGTAVFALVAVAVIVLLLDKSQSANTGRVGIIAFATVAFCILVAMFATWMGKERGAAVMGAEPSDSRSVAFGMVAAFVFIFAILGGLFYLDHKRKTTEAAEVAQNQEEVDQIIDIPQEQPTPDPGTAGFNKGSGGGSKPKQEKAGGGGGGGRQEATPASAGKLPQASLEVPQILPPDPKPPVVKNPSLPVAATVNADPMLVPPDARVLPYGDPKSRSTTPSSGPGTGNGIGNGTGTGVGSGEGNGVGPGRGGNIGGGDMHAGGGGPGGGGGGGDYNRVFSGKEVTSKARVLSKPEPQYTEEARKNQIVGTVLLQAVFSASGEVTQIRALRPLPYGLTEKAIAAARMIKFVPAMKDGHAVSMYMHLEYNFNLY
ncbi:MAG TPA: energy transducer TonB [Pyrinomonadaceae bacterium]|nr:energy transducer TonB [Pyrinomonadaceae bacterium]